jgi:hypothetical protein
MNIGKVEVVEKMNHLKMKTSKMKIQHNQGDTNQEVKVAVVVNDLIMAKVNSNKEEEV